MLSAYTDHEALLSGCHRALVSSTSQFCPNGPGSLRSCAPARASRTGSPLCQSMGCGASAGPAAPAQQPPAACPAVTVGAVPGQVGSQPYQPACQMQMGSQPYQAGAPTVAAGRGDALLEFLRGLGVRDTGTAAAALQSAGISAPGDFFNLDKDMRQELDEELKRGGVTLGDRAKIKKAEQGAKVQQGNGTVSVTMLKVGEAMQAASSLERVFLGLGWKERPGLSKSIDVDASCIGFSSGAPVETISFKNLRNVSRSLVHTGDVLSGQPPDGKRVADLERMYVWLSKIPSHIDSLVFVANVYTQGADFAELSDAYIRLVNADTNQEVSRFPLAGTGLKGNALVFAKLYRYGQHGPWQLLALGQPLTVPGCSSIDQMYPQLQSSGSALPYSPNGYSHASQLPGAPQHGFQSAAQDGPQSIGKPPAKSQTPSAMFLCPALAVGTVAGVAAATAIFMSDDISLDMMQPSVFETGVDFTSLVPSADTLAGVEELLPTDELAAAYEWAGGVMEGVDFDGAGEALSEAVGTAGDGVGAAASAIGDAAPGIAEAVEGFAGDAGEAVGGFASDAFEAAPGALDAAGGFASDAYEAAPGALDAAGGFASDAYEAAPGALDAAGGFAGDAFEAAPGALDAAGGFAGDAFEAAPGALDAAGGFAGDAFEAAPGALDAAGGDGPVFHHHHHKLEGEGGGGRGGGGRGGGGPIGRLCWRRF
ncbi:unnamed protein product [Prorocentrum cordatum]|uniref:TerD domain-containing protein n=1 Tax=Prorocentrum cordatum TaxID=2364126 RepID=A0ABN9TGN6_9DINO|nr:unnamed protein product [Polarella glacialis]